MTGLQDVPRILRKHWLKAAVAFAVTLATVAVGTFLATPVYEASAVVLVRLGREYLSEPGLGDRRAVINRDSESVINNEIQILRSADLVRRVVTEIGETDLYPDLADAAPSSAPPLARAEQRFEAGYGAQALPDTSVIRLTFRHPDPDMVARALNILVGVYREKHLETFGNPGAMDFLEEQVASHRARLEEAEAHLNELLRQDPSLASKRADDSLFTQRERLEIAANEAQSRIDGLGGELRFLAAERDAVGERNEATGQAQDNRAVESAKLRLLNLQLEEQRLLGSYSEENRQVVNMGRQIELAEAFLAEQEERIGAQGTSADLEREILEKEGELRFESARVASLRSQLATLSEVLTALPSRQARYRDLARARDVHEENYKTTLKQYENARIAEEMDRQKMASISVIQEARVPIEPVSPRKRLNLAVGALLGAALALAVALAAEMTGGASPAQPL